MQICWCLRGRLIKLRIAHKVQFAMSKEKDNSEELLARAYSLRTDEDSKALYKDWAETYDAQTTGEFGWMVPR